MIYQVLLCQYTTQEVTLNYKIPVGSAKGLCLEVVLDLL